MLESHWLAYATDGATYAEASVDSARAHVLFTAALAMKLHFACRQSGSRMKHYMEAELAGMHLDDARLHTSVVTRQKRWDLGWEVLMHPPYSPDLAPSDYNLFLAFKNFLSDKNLGTREDCGNRLLEFFANKDQDFHERGIMKPPLKWQQIIQQNGAYLTQIGQSET
ncbi:histone-lysine N-methyltransferase SETMAR [Trichonephila clavipes]|nr:histone-lysine N-methyltransferase SETMAR [Trichonephila clavipes]